MITVPNMNKISPCFSEISHQIHKMYEIVTIITQVWHRAKCCFTSMSNAWYLITVPNMNKITTFNSQQTDRSTDRLNPFLCSPIPLRQRGNNKQCTVDLLIFVKKMSINKPILVHFQNQYTLYEMKLD